MMSENDPRLAMIRANAEMARAELAPRAGMALGYDAGSLAWIDSFLDREHAILADPADAETLVTVIGSFLGEAIIAAVGGTWAVHERDEIGILLASGDWCFPFTKVAKELAHGREGGQSILGFYTATVELFGQAPSEEAA